MNDVIVINNGVLVEVIMIIVEEEEMIDRVVDMRVAEKEIGEVAVVAEDMMVMMMIGIVTSEVDEMMTAAITIHPIEGMM